MPRLAVVLLCAAALYGLLAWVARRSTYFPFRYPQGFWELKTELGAEDVFLLTADGLKLHAWWAPKPGAPLVTLFLHGNAGNVTHRAPHIAALKAAGSSVLAPDYRGYGKSDGAPSERGLYADADAGYEWLTARGYKPRQIVIHGESLGTAVAVDLAARKSCAAVVLEAPFNSAAAVAATVLPLLGPLVVRGFNSKSKIARVHAPLLFIQGDRDEVVPYRLGRDLFDAAPEPKTFWTVPGAGHNDLLETAGQPYPDRLAAFYRTAGP